MHHYTRTALLLIVTSIALVALCLATASADTRTTPVTIDTSGNTVKIDSTANTVKIDSANNTVKTVTQHNMVQLWTTAQIVPNLNSISAPVVSTAGYKEMRTIIATTSSVAIPNLFAVVAWQGPTGSYVPMGRFDFNTPTHPITEQCDFVSTAGYLVVNIPVMGDNCSISITNMSGSTVTISQTSYVYLVN
jgi:hypothetical protein